MMKVEIATGNALFPWSWVEDLAASCSPKVRRTDPTRMSIFTCRIPYLGVIRSPRYFPLWLGQIVSNLGDTLNYVAVVVLVFRLSHSGLAVSALVLAEIMPTLLLGPVAGVLIDRFDRKRLLIAADLVRAGLILALAVTHVLWGVYVIAALLTAA